MNTTSLPKPKQPNWWSPSIGAYVIIGFGLLAALPYLVSATKLVAAGEDISIEKLSKETEKEKKKYDKPEQMREVKAVAVASDGTAWAGGKAGLFKRMGTMWLPEDGYPGVEVKSLAVAPSGEVLAVDEHHVFTLGNDGKWAIGFEGEAHSVSVTSDGAA